MRCRIARSCVARRLPRFPFFAPIPFAVINLSLPLRKSAVLLALAGSAILIVSGAGVTPAMGQGATGAAPGEPVGDAGRGLKKSATCVGCHSIPGYKADFPMVYSVPMLGGQNAKYIENALKEYQKGERRFPSMMATAKSLSDQDIADVAAYFAAQR